MSFVQYVHDPTWFQAELSVLFQSFAEKHGMLISTGNLPTF